MIPDWIVLVFAMGVAFGLGMLFQSARQLSIFKLPTKARKG